MLEETVDRHKKDLAARDKELGQARAALASVEGDKTRLESERSQLLTHNRELQTAVDGVGSGQMPDLLAGQLARDALVLCHKECQSVKTGRAVNV